ncbi:hypothetical protein Tco_0830152 [Tanacetum coccineum]
MALSSNPKLGTTFQSDCTGHRIIAYFGGEYHNWLVPDLQTFPMSNKFRVRVKHSDLKQALRGRHPMLIVDCPGFVRTLRACIFIKSFTSSASFWESSIQI